MQKPEVYQIKLSLLIQIMKKKLQRQRIQKRKWIQTIRQMKSNVQKNKKLKKEKKIHFFPFFFNFNLCLI